MKRGSRGWAVVAVAGVFGLLSGCAMLLPKGHVSPEGALPETFTGETGDVDSPDRWWEAFGSPELNALVDEAFVGNLTLRQAWARLDQSGATARQVASSLYPDLTAEADVSYERRRTTVETESPSLAARMGDSAAGAVGGTISNTVSSGIQNRFGVENESAAGNSSGSSGDTSGAVGGSSTVQVTTETKRYALGVAASYEVDLWRRIWSERQAAQLDVSATHDELESTAMSLAAEIVTHWLAILEQQAQWNLLSEQLKTNRTYLELVELRFRKSLVSALDVFQQRQAVAAIEKLMPLVAAEAEVLRHELAVLLGKPPSAELPLGEHDLAEVPPVPATGVPAELLNHRPDVRAAYARLASADFRVSAARADRLPSIRLTGGAAYSAGELEYLFDDWFANLAAGLTAPLFDGFRREAEVERTRAVVEEHLAAYRLTVLTAIREVEDAIVLERGQGEYITALERELEDARSALKEAGQRYQKGLNDYLPVLTALETTQRLTRDLLLARRELLVFRVDLYRALGGSWTNQLEAPRRLSEETPLAKAEN